MIKKVLVSQPKPLSDRNPYADMAAQFGVEFDFRQMIHIEGLDAKEFRQQHVYVQDYTAVLMNSRVAIDQYFRMCQELRFQVPDSMHYYCISESVANYLQKYIQYRKRKVFFAEHNRFDELLPAMNRRPNEKYMMVMSDVHNDDVINMFASNNIEIRPAVMYRTVPSEWPKDLPFDYDMVVLFTSTGVASLKQNFPDLKQGDKVIACFGQSTASALQEIGLTPDLQAPSPQYPSITSALRDYLEKHQDA